MRRTAKYNEACRLFDQKNDAEIVHEIQRQTGRPLKSLDPDAYNRVRPVYKAFTPVEDLPEGAGFRVGDRVQRTRLGMINATLAGDRVTGIVKGVRIENGVVMVRVNGHYYDPRQWEKRQ